MLRSRVPPECDGLLLLDWLVGRFRYFDANGWQAQLAAGRLVCAGAVAMAGSRVHAGDEVVFTPAPAPASPDREPVPILHADDDLVVVDKPAHRVVQAASAFAQHTFRDEVAKRLPPSARADRLEPVHRLDRETSGVLLLARHAAAVRALQVQFASGTVHKEYVAVVHGRVASPTLRIDAAIGPAPGSAVAARRAVLPADAPGAQSASTGIEVEALLPAHSVLRVQPRTGRTHQIRVHLEHIAHPIVGDTLYGRSDAFHLAWVQQRKADDAAAAGALPTTRLLLHASVLRCRHPVHGAPLAFTAPPPVAFAAFVAANGG